MEISAKLISSLEKLTPECAEPKGENAGSCLKGEKYHFQLGIKGIEEAYDFFKMVIESPIKEYITCYNIKNVPVNMGFLREADDKFLNPTIGLIPDVAQKSDLRFRIPMNIWDSFYFEVNVTESLPAGEYPIKIVLNNDEDELVWEDTYTLKVINAVLPPQKLIYTSWFHNDCLSDYYNVPVFSEEHWKIIGNFMENAADYGVNMILTPVFTPALDTIVGGERPTVQLVGVKYENGKYEFEFSKLTRYIDLALSKGIEYFEIAHFFSQWGANATPKIEVEENGEIIKKFGWHTAAVSDEYKEFLYAFIPAIKEYMKERNLLDKCYFHMSDEPNIKHLENYTAVSEMTKPLLSDCNVIDALSDYDFYQRGLVKTPIPEIMKIEEFIEKGVDKRWTYYCCGHENKVSNRFIAMPSYRTRALGLQLFKFQIEGFLQWGFNFYYTSFSRYMINPYLCNDAQYSFPAGDAFVVYPGFGGNPEPSLREFVFYDALQDMRALQLLADLTSFGETVKWLEEQLGMKLSFTDYPDNAEAILKLRQAINERIAENI